jgi:hypothetical protein
MMKANAIQVGMSEVKFVLHGEGFPIGSLVACPICNALAHGPHPIQCCVKSNVTVDILKLFISTIEGENIELKSFLKGIVTLKDTPVHRLGRLEEGFAKLEETINALQNNLIPTMQSTLELSTIGWICFNLPSNSGNHSQEASGRSEGTEGFHWDLAV